MSRLVNAALSALLLVSLAPTPAQAFCRRWSCNPAEEATKSCPPDPGNKDCPGGDPARHRPLYWPQKCVGFSLNIGSGKKFDANIDRAQAKVARIVDLSFATWQKADCGGGRRPSLAFYDLGFVECDRHEFNNYQPGSESAEGNANLVVIHDKWPYADSNQLAFTTLTFSKDSGEIYDVDIEINGQADLTTADTNAKFDLQSILTHEIGYFLGLSNSRAQDSVMFAQAAEGSLSNRVLAGDDVAAVCALYKPDREGLPECDPTPRHGLGAACGTNVVQAEACAVGSPGRSPRSALPALGGLAALAGAVVVRARGLHRGRRRR